MPVLKKHCQRSLERYGTDGREIHSWMDEPVSVIGPTHRIYRHDRKDFKMLPLPIKQKYGKELALQIFLDHIIYDEETNSLSKNHSRWTKDEINILRRLELESINLKELARKGVKLLNRSEKSIYSKGTKLNLDPHEIRTCPECGTEFKTKLPFQKFCSKVCKNRNNSKNEPIVCIECGRKFRGKKGRKYCSDECSTKYWKKQNQKLKTLKQKENPKICQHCGKEYTGRGNKYCSTECRIRYKLEHSSIPKEIKIICKECGKEFIGNTYRTLCHDCWQKRLQQQIEGGSVSREFARFILLLREHDRDSYLRIRELYVNIVNGEAGSRPFDKWLNKFKNKIETEIS